MNTVLEPENTFYPDATYDGMHDENSMWLTEGSRKAGKHIARWVKRPSIHGFVDFRHVFRPHKRGVSPTESGVAIARCTLEIPF